MSDPGTDEESFEKSAADSPFIQYSPVKTTTMRADETEISAYTKGVIGKESKGCRDSKEGKTCKGFKSKQGKTKGMVNNKDERITGCMTVHRQEHFDHQ
jgi:hypothetical protein